MKNGLSTHVPQIAAQLGIAAFSPQWSGIDAVWPIIEKMRQEGAVVILKLDGERTGKDDTGPYTALVSGARLQGDFIRTDTNSVEEALSYIICHYAARFWEIPLPL